MRRFLENRLAVAGLIVIFFLYGVALTAPWISRYSYKEQLAGLRDSPPSAMSVFSTPG